MCLQCLCLSGGSFPRLHGLLLPPNWRVFGLAVQVLLERGLPAAVAGAIDILLNQILQKVIVKKGFPVASSTLAAMQVSLIHILQKAEGKRKSRGPCLLLFLPIEPLSGSEWLFLVPLACDVCS